MRRLLLSVSVLLVVSGLANAEVDLTAANRQVDAISTGDAGTIAPVKKWYVGGAIGVAELIGWNRTSTQDYYHSLGYYNTGGSFWNVMSEGKIYAGYRMLDYMDLEFGYSMSEGSVSETYTNAGNTVWSRREVTAQALYASALLRPPYGSGHMLYFKFGGHASQLEVSKSVTGNPANLSAIAAGDRMPEDGVSSGFGTLFGIGLDFRIGKAGAIRLERNRYHRIGGTSYSKDALNLGYQGNF